MTVITHHRTATARACANIALIKYWGKRDAVLNLPAAGSLSLTLAALITETTVRFDDALAHDQLVLDGLMRSEGSLASVHSLASNHATTFQPRPALHRRRQGSQRSPLQQPKLLVSMYHIANFRSWRGAALALLHARSTANSFACMQDNPSTATMRTPNRLQAHWPAAFA
jgi:hypothetical protein